MKGKSRGLPRDQYSPLSPPSFPVSRVHPKFKMPTFTVFKGHKDGVPQKSTTTKPDQLVGDSVFVRVTASGVCGTGSWPNLRLLPYIHVLHTDKPPPQTSTTQVNPIFTRGPRGVHD